MKMRISVLMAALLLLCSLIGCAEDVVDSTGSSGSVQESGSTEGSGNNEGSETTESLIKPEELEGTILINSDPNWVYAGRHEGTFGDQGYYYVKKSILHFLDTSSGVTTALCTKAGCLHAEEENNRERENCDAYVGITFNVPFCFWDGHLYYMHGIQLYRCNATGTERAVAGELGSRYTRNQKTVTVESYAMTEGFWYYQGAVSGIVRDEETGAGVFQQELEYIARVDLSTGKEEILLEDKEADLILNAVSGGGVLFSVREWEDAYYALKFLNLETEKIGTLFRKNDQGYICVNMVANNKVYYHAAKNAKMIHYCHDMSTGQEETLFSQGSVRYFGGGYVLRTDANTQDWYLLEIDSGKKLPVDLTGVNVGAIGLECLTDNGCILSWSVRTESGSNGGTGYAFVAYASLDDGLQKSDLVHYYTLKNGLS